MKSLFILFLCLSFFGCSTTQVEKTVIPNNEVETIPEEEMISVVENNQQNINEQKVNIEIEQYKYYRINSPEGLRRREMPSLDSKVLGVYPDNYIVYVSEIGKELVEIDGISNYWVKIGHNNDPSRIISISSVLPIGLAILTRVLPQEHFLRERTQISRVR